MNYSYILKNEKNISSDDNRNLDINKLLKNGYTIIRRNNKNKIELIKNNSTEEIKKKIEKEDFVRKFNAMIKNWDNFRDNDIELMGDRSIYINYKDEINKLIEEDKELEDIINERNIYYTNKDYDYSSDEESNKYLLY